MSTQPISASGLSGLSVTFENDGSLKLSLASNQGTQSADKTSSSSNSNGLLTLLALLSALSGSKSDSSGSSNAAAANSGTGAGSSSSSSLGSAIGNVLQQAFGGGSSSSSSQAASGFLSQILDSALPNYEKNAGSNAPGALLQGVGKLFEDLGAIASGQVPGSSSAASSSSSAPASSSSSSTAAKYANSSQQAIAQIAASYGVSTDSSLNAKATSNATAAASNGGHEGIAYMQNDMLQNLLVNEFGTTDANSWKNPSAYLSTMFQSVMNGFTPGWTDQPVTASSNKNTDSKS